MGEPLHIALTFDDAFWGPAYATMRSVCLATTRRTDLVFHLLHWHLAAENRPILDAIAQEFGARVVHYPLEQEPRIGMLIEGLPGTRKFPAVVYARLLLDELLPADVDRVLYLDSDLYVRAPVEMLIEMSMRGYSLAAAPEPGRQHLVRGDDMRTRMGPFDPAEPYFNSGVLMIDRRAWGRARLLAYLEFLRSSGQLDQLFHDQDVLNLRFRGEWLRLDPMWNLTKPHPAVRALDPYIVHYTTGMKPWNRFAYVAFGSSYKHVMTRAVLKRYRRYRFGLWLRRLFNPKA